MGIFLGKPVEKLVNDVNMLEISACNSLSDLILGGTGEEFIQFKMGVEEIHYFGLILFLEEGFALVFGG